MATNLPVAHNSYERQMTKVADILVARMLREAGQLPDDNNIYRVSMENLPRIIIMCLGDGYVDSVCDGEYYGLDALPNWVKERIAVLMLCSATPPMPTVDGVGRRINEHIFWVFAPTTVREPLTKLENEDG